jgi:hypothetical protein
MLVEAGTCFVMTHFKALSLIQARIYVRERWGDDGIAKLQHELSPAACTAVYSEQLLATDWVDIRYCIEHAIAIDRVFGNGDGRTSAEMIRGITHNHFSSLYRSMFTGVSPRAMLEKTSRLWNRFYDQGETEVEFPNNTCAVKRILNCPDLPLHHDWFLVPYYEELLRLCGAQDPVVRHTKCVALKAKYCETELRWSDPPSVRPVK